MTSPILSLTDTLKAAELDDLGLEEQSVQLMLEDFTDYLVTEHTGRNRKNRYGTEHLDSDEIPDRKGREGQTHINMSFDDIQYLFDDRVAANSYGLPEEGSENAFGALFGASYALKRHRIAQRDSFSEESQIEFKDSIENDHQLRNFMEAGAYEIRRKIMGDQGYDYPELQNIMNPEAAMEAYNEIVQEVTGEELADRLMDY